MFRKTVGSLIIMILVAGQVGGTTRHGGKGLIYVHSARILPVGHLQFYGGTRYYGKIAQVETGNRAYAIWNVKIYSTFNIGVSSHLELAISPILYQDTNNSDGNALNGQANIPDDILFGFKLGSFGRLESPFVFGGMLYGRIPTAKEHNIIYEPYSAGGFEVGLTGMVSYFSNPIFPDESWSIHGNLGYLNHNDVGRELTNDPMDLTPLSMSSEILFGLGFHYPAGTFDFSAEINARYFLVDPPVTAYSGEYVSYLTTGVYYKPYPWVTFEMGFDLRLVSEQDLSQYAPVTSLSPPPTEDFPNYPTWRGILGVKLGILPASLYSNAESDLLRQRAEDRKAALERMLEGQKETEDAESELAKIRAERKKVEEELRRLRKLLEEERKKKKKKKGDGIIH